MKNFIVLLFFIQLTAATDLPDSPDLPGIPKGDLIAIDSLVSQALQSKDFPVKESIITLQQADEPKTYRVTVNVTKMDDTTTSFTFRERSIVIPNLGTRRTAEEVGKDLANQYYLYPCPINTGSCIQIPSYKEENVIQLTNKYWRPMSRFSGTEDLRVGQDTEDLHGVGQDVQSLITKYRPIQPKSDAPQKRSATALKSDLCSAANKGEFDLD